MQPVLAALIIGERRSTNAAAMSPPPSVVFAIETLLHDPDHLITTVTVCQPVSSREEAEAIGSAVRRVVFEHDLAVEIALRRRHVRVRLCRLSMQREGPGGED